MTMSVKDCAVRVGDRFLVEARNLLDASDGYYQQRLLDGQAFNTDEIAVVEWCVANLSPGSRVCEIGSGLGQLCLLLDATGFSAVGVDGDARRNHLAERLAWRLGSGAEYVFGEYPHVAPECDLLVTTNVVGGWWSVQPGTMLEKLRRFFRRSAIICPKTFWSLRDGDELVVLQHDIENAGFVVDPTSDTVWHIKVNS